MVAEAHARSQITSWGGGDGSQVYDSKPALFILFYTARRLIKPLAFSLSLRFLFTEIQAGFYVRHLRVLKTTVGVERSPRRAFRRFPHTVLVSGSLVRYSGDVRTSKEHVPLANASPQRPAAALVFCCTRGLDHPYQGHRDGERWPAA